ncbi:MAG: FAD-dependent oxidoreductase [Pyrinomonadaceae bacterium]
MRPKTRRQFLKQGALAVAGVSLTGSKTIATAATNFVLSSPPKKVVILGAGMAGLVAGYELLQLGHDVTILEARMRPGGRVNTLREPFSDGLYAEAGAARIPDDHDLTLKYVKLFEVALEPMYPASLSALRVDKTISEMPMDGFTGALGQFFGDELGGKPARWSKIKGGTDMLPKAFARGLADKIHYGSPVMRIEQDANSARAVFLQGGTPQTLTADRILCTIPYSVLRNIELPPNFSERKRDIIKGLHYDSVSRVYLQTKKRFWEDKGLNGFAITGDAVEIWQPTWSQPGPRGILMTYNRPGQAERIAAMKEPQRVSSTLAQLEKLYPGLHANFEGAATKCWEEDEWSRGAWASVGLKDLVNATRPEGRIHFAGEHLSAWPSWMQGALASGLRAVKEIDEV